MMTSNRRRSERARIGTDDIRLSATRSHSPEGGGISRVLALGREPIPEFLTTVSLLMRPRARPLTPRELCGSEIELILIGVRGCVVENGVVECTPRSHVLRNGDRVS